MTPVLINLPSPRRPGGAQGAPFPDDLAVGARVQVWLTDGQSFALYVGAEADPAPILPWEAVDWWIPL